MTAKPYILFSDNEILAIKGQLDSKVYEWSESIFGDVLVGVSSLCQSYLQYKGSIELWNQPDLDAQFDTVIETKAFSIKLSANSNEWLSGLGISPLADYKDQKKSAIRSDEASILLNAITQSFFDSLSTLNIGIESPISDSGLFHRSAIKGAGILFYSVKLHGLSINVLIDGQQFKTTKKQNNFTSTKEHKRMESRLSACEEISTSMKAFLGVIDLSVGDLSKISPGDIIRLDASTSDLVSLSAATKQVICHGRLGTKDGHKALRIVG